MKRFVLILCLVMCACTSNNKDTTVEEVSKLSNQTQDVVIKRQGYVLYYGMNRNIPVKYHGLVIEEVSSCEDDENVITYLCK